MQTIRVSDKNATSVAIEIIKEGGVVVCPTDTVYGFIADASNKKAVDKIFKIKKRAKSKPLPVFIKDIKMAKDLAEIDDRQEKILKKYWSGKYTFILKQNSCDIGSRTKLYGVDKKTIALRIPKYKFLNNLLKKINKPLAQTSVNISGQPPLNKIKDIITSFESKKNKPDLIIYGGNLKSHPSKIIDLTEKTERILRN